VLFAAGHASISFVPAGLDFLEAYDPSVETLGYCQKRWAIASRAIVSGATQELALVTRYCALMAITITQEVVTL
jgi:hypothetical protein